MIKTASFSTLNNTSMKLQVGNVLFKLKYYNLEICKLTVIKAKIGEILEKANNRNNGC